MICISRVIATGLYESGKSLTGAGSPIPALNANHSICQHCLHNHFDCHSYRFFSKLCCFNPEIPAENGIDIRSDRNMASFFAAAPPANVRYA